MPRARRNIKKQAAVLREAEKEIASGKTSLSMAPALAQLQMQLAEEQLEEAKAEVTDGKAQLEEAKQQLADGKAELDDAKQQLADGEQALAELEVPEWFLLTRSENVSYASFEMNIEKVDAVAKVFPVFFFLVAALVALTTMTRMVEEDRLQIGTLKALGYGKGLHHGKNICCMPWPPACWAAHSALQWASPCCPPLSGTPIP